MTTRRRIGLALSALWLIAVMIAISGHCQVTPQSVRDDPILNPPPATPPGDGAATPGQP